MRALSTYSCRPIVVGLYCTVSYYTVSYHCNGLPLCPWLCPLLPPRPLLPSVGCCVLRRGVSFWSLVPVWLLCSEGPFRLWVHQHGMISPLSCVPCWWPTLPNFTSL